mmetsp:Transcript_14532/g.57970  ORF Transcript_14532/g.57970 Transcript_14532/m.57970 type:complete len:379 (-) Transcript_14532:782-1918(-)
MTLKISRFIASHMMWVRMAPDEPIKAPTTVSNGLSSMNPSAQSAQPEYELSTVMTTGMSAPPIEAVMWRPRAPERPAAAPNAANPVVGEGCAMNRPIAPIDAMPMPMFMTSRPGSASGAEPRFPLSLPNATTEPVAVMPPIHVARYSDVAVTVSITAGAVPPAASTRCAYSPIAVPAAARPTSEWKAATVCGSSVGDTRVAMAYPAAPPTPSRPAIWTAVPGSGLRWPSVAAMPSVTPACPRMLPMRAVVCDESPAMPPMHASPESSATGAVRSPRPVSPAMPYAPNVAATGMPYKYKCSSGSVSRLKRSSIFLVTRKPPTMLTVEIAVASAPNDSAVVCGKSPPPTRTSPPAAVMPEMAFVTAIRGEWSAGTTLNTE